MIDFIHSTYFKGLLESFSVGFGWTFENRVACLKDHSCQAIEAKSQELLKHNVSCLSHAPGFMVNSMGEFSETNDQGEKGHEKITGLQIDF